VYLSCTVPSVCIMEREKGATKSRLSTEDLISEQIESQRSSWSRRRGDSHSLRMLYRRFLYGDLRGFGER
jgi:hypothetical protein